MFGDESHKSQETLQTMYMFGDESHVSQTDSGTLQAMYSLVISHTRRKPT